VRATAGKPAGAWRSGRRRRDVEQRGEGQRGSGERRARRWRGTWHGEERCGVARARESGRRRRRSGVEGNREREGWR
jgi:hypothetical protein